MKKILALLLALLVICTSLVGCDLLESIGLSDGKNPSGGSDQNKNPQKNEEVLGFASIEGIPDYDGKAWVALNDNLPLFTEEEKATVKSYETYSDLDSLGRCGVTHACVGKDIMPTEERESISSVKPSGWVNNKYDTELVDGGYIYNRCHLIGFQLTGENANKQNLITGTRYLNIEGMLPFENMVADYVKETGNHVMYRVTPLYAGNNLVASGCRLEGWSVEDNGEGVCFHVFAYNVQPGIVIDYATGENWLNTDAPVDTDKNENQDENKDETQNTGDGTYVLNTNTKVIHLPTCSSAIKTSTANKKEHSGSIDALLAEGYKKCGICLD